MKKAVKKKPFIYYEDLKPWENIATIIYGLATIGVIVTLLCDNHETAENYVILYILSPPIFFILFFYVSLRNFKSYLIWIGFGLVHAILFFIFKCKPGLQIFHGKPPLIFFNTIILLLVFQIFRYLSLTIQHREFVIPSRSGTDLFENIQPTVVDNIIFIGYMASFVSLNIFFLSRLSPSHITPYH